MSWLLRLCVNHFVSNTSKLSLSAWALSIARWPCIHIPRQTTLDDVSFVITFPKRTKSKSPKDRNASQKSKFWLFNLFKIWCNSDTEYTGDNLAGGFQKCSEHPAPFKKFQIIRNQCDKSSQFVWSMHITVPACAAPCCTYGHCQDGLCAIRLTPSPKFFLSNVCLSNEALSYVILSPKKNVHKNIKTHQRYHQWITKFNVRLRSKWQKLTQIHTRWRQKRQGLRWFLSFSRTKMGEDLKVSPFMSFQSVDSGWFWCIKHPSNNTAEAGKLAEGVPGVIFRHGQTSPTTCEPFQPPQYLAKARGDFS